MEDLRKLGFDFVFRTAGSHSPFDVVGIDKSKKIIKLIQSKRVMSGDMSEVNAAIKDKLEREYSELNDVFKVVFEVL